MKITKLSNCVLDTSVIIKWYSQDNEADCEKANRLIADCKNGNLKLLIPDLLIYELGNALLKGKQFSYLQLKLALDHFYSLKVEIFSASYNLLDKAIQIASEYKLTVYDATYIALAQIKNCQLITANPRCFSKVKEDFVINLSDLKMD